jgi:hypothetical protein
MLPNWLNQTDYPRHRHLQLNGLDQTDLLQPNVINNQVFISGLVVRGQPKGLTIP